MKKQDKTEPLRHIEQEYLDGRLSMEDYVRQRKQILFKDGRKDKNMA